MGRKGMTSPISCISITGALTVGHVGDMNHARWLFRAAMLQNFHKDSYTPLYEAIEALQTLIKQPAYELLHKAFMLPSMNNMAHTYKHNGNNIYFTYSISSSVARLISLYIEWTSVGFRFFTRDP